MHHTAAFQFPTGLGSFDWEIAGCTVRGLVAGSAASLAAIVTGFARL